MDIECVQRFFLDRLGYSHFGEICSETGEVLGFCYQKDKKFFFVDSYGEVIPRPKGISQPKDFFEDPFWDQDEALNDLYGYTSPRIIFGGYSVLLLHFKNGVYTICNPSTSVFCSIYNYLDGEYFFLCPNNVCIAIQFYSSTTKYFEFIDNNNYIYLSFHEEYWLTNLFDSRQDEVFAKSILYDKINQKCISISHLIDEQEAIVAICVDPVGVIVFNNKMDVIYNKEAHVVFWNNESNSYLVFPNYDVAYNIQRYQEIPFDRIDDYDNVDAYKDFFIKYSIDDYKGKITEPDEDILNFKEDFYHLVTEGTVYNSELKIVRAFKVLAEYSGIEEFEGKIRIKLETRGAFPTTQYIDVNGRNCTRYNHIYKSRFSIPDSKLTRLFKNYFITESFDFFNYLEDDDYCNCKLMETKGDKMITLNGKTYSCMKPFAFFHSRDITLDPTYIVGIYDADMKYDIYSNRQLIFTGTYYDENLIQMCHEGRRVIFKSDGHYGIIGDGKILCPAEYNLIEPFIVNKSSNIFIVNNGKSFGIADNNGGLILPFEYELIMAYNDINNDLYIIVCESKNVYSWGYYDIETNSIVLDCPSEPDSNDLLHYGKVRYNIKSNLFEEDIDVDDYDDNEHRQEWTKEDPWDAMTDGKYGDYPGGNIDYDALGF